MNEQDYKQLQELSWRRPLTQTEAVELEKYLAAHPAAQADWENQIALSQLLERLPAAPPVASNFTARVLQTFALENAARNRGRTRGFGFRKSIPSWLPRAAFAALVIVGGITGYHQHEVNERAALAKNVVEFTAAVSASDPEAMQDYEPIRHLSDAQPKADIELLALMK